MTLAELVDRVFAQEALTPSWRGPMRHAVKQYAEALGVDATRATPDTYHLPDAKVRAVVETHTPERLARKTVENRWRNVCHLLHIGVQRGWLLPLDGKIYSWRGRTRLGRQRLFPLERPTITRTSYYLKPLPPALSAELEAYLQWCTELYTPTRDADPAVRIRKRQISANHTRHMIAAMSGFCVHVRGESPDDLSLARLTDPQLCRAFTGWWKHRHGRVSVGLKNILIPLKTIARHWLNHAEHAAAIHRFIQSLPITQVRDKQALMVSLHTLRQVAEGMYPFNEQRLRESTFAQLLARHLEAPLRYQKPYSSAKRLAVQAEISLLISMMIEWPWRQRQYRDMRIGHHLHQQPDGTFKMLFKGLELKIDERHGGTNILQGTLTDELAERMSEWLTMWRPMLVTDPQETHVFVTMKGKAADAHTIQYWVRSATFRFAGVPVHPHLIRDIWASEYIAETGDVAGAADRLGNTMQTVFRHYGHVLEARAQARTTQWLHTHLGQPVLSPAVPNGHQPSAAPPHTPSWRERIRQPSVADPQLPLPLP